MCNCTCSSNVVTCSKRNKKRKFKGEAKSGKTLNFLFLFLLEHVLCRMRQFCFTGKVVNTALPCLFFRAMTKFFECDCSHSE